MKKYIKIISIVSVCILIILTFVSQSVYNKSLPQVTAYKVKQGLVPLTVETTANLEYENEIVLKSNDEWKISEVVVKDGDIVSEGDLLIKFDVRVSKIEKMSLDLEISILNNSLKNLYGDSKKQAEASLEIAKAKLELFISNAPPEDGLLAPCNGTVYGLSAKSGDKIAAETELLKILPNSHPKLKFELPAKDGEVFGPGSLVNAKIEVVDHNIKSKEIYFYRRVVTGTISHGILNGDHWECVVDLNPFEGLPVAGQEIPVKTVQNGQVQENVVPIESIFDENNKKIVYVIDARPGLFGMEEYISSVPVEILYQNENFASIKSDNIYIGMVLAVDPSDPVKSDDTVWVKTKKS